MMTKLKIFKIELIFFCVIFLSLKQTLKTEKVFDRTYFRSTSGYYPESLYDSDYVNSKHYQHSNVLIGLPIGGFSRSKQPFGLLAYLVKSDLPNLGKKYTNVFDYSSFNYPSIDYLTFKSQLLNHPSFDDSSLYHLNEKNSNQKNSKTIFEQPIIGFFKL